LAAPAPDVKPAAVLHALHAVCTVWSITMPATMMPIAATKMGTISPTRVATAKLLCVTRSSDTSCVLRFVVLRLKGMERFSSICVSSSDTLCVSQLMQFGCRALEE